MKRRLAEVVRLASRALQELSDVLDPAERQRKLWGNTLEQWKRDDECRCAFGDASPGFHGNHEHATVPAAQIPEIVKADEPAEETGARVVELPELVTAKEAAAMLGLGQASVYRYAKLGRLVSYKLPGGQVRIDKESVEKMVAERAAARKGKPSPGNPIVDEATPTGELVGVGEAKEILGVTDAAVRKAIIEGRLPAEKVGGVVSLKREDVEAYRDRPKRRGPKPRPRGNPTVATPRRRGRPSGDDYWNRKESGAGVQRVDTGDQVPAVAREDYKEDQMG